MWVVYGIKNCDSIKKARLWLAAQQIDYRFHDYRVDGLSRELLQEFINALGIDAILNQRSSSWRQLTPEQKTDLSPEKALNLLLTNPTLLKRPILHNGKQLFVGFNPDLWISSR